MLLGSEQSSLTSGAEKQNKHIRNKGVQWKKHRPRQRGEKPRDNSAYIYLDKHQRC